MQSIDLTGQRAGRWTVIKRAENTSQGQAQWLCRCDCGTEKVLKSIIIRRGISKSCGCLKSEVTAARSTKHGHSTNGIISPTYHSWAGMVARCTNPNHNSFHRYGGRGITVCERWLTFENFLADMGEKPPNTSLERNDNSKGYSPINCVWAESKQQANNRSNNHPIKIGKVTKTLAEWCELKGINRGTVRDRLDHGWTPEEAFNTPAGTATNNAKSRMLTHNGKTLCVADWAKLLGISPGVIYQRLLRGKSDSEALQKPR